MRRKTLRRVSAQQSPLRPECALPLLHKIILAKLASMGIFGYQPCGGNKTFAPFACVM